MDQIGVPFVFASVKTRLPLLESESFEFFPLTGWSRFAIQTTAGCLDFVK
jgi:hypothetical protein